MAARGFRAGSPAAGVVAEATTSAGASQRASSSAHVFMLQYPRWSLKLSADSPSGSVRHLLQPSHCTHARSMVRLRFLLAAAVALALCDAKPASALRAVMKAASASGSTPSATPAPAEDGGVVST